MNTGLGGLSPHKSWLEPETNKEGPGEEKGEEVVQMSSECKYLRGFVLFKTVSWHLTMNVVSQELRKYLLDR